MSTNNDILFLCERDILNNKSTIETQKAINYFITDFYYYKGDESKSGQNFSHDNWTGIYCFFKLFNPQRIKKLPLWGRHSWRPDNFAFYYFAKKKFLYKLMYPIMKYAMIKTMKRIERKDKDGNMHISTSGQILNYFKCHAFGLKKIKNELDLMVNEHPKIRNWGTIFEIYFGGPTGNKEVWKAWQAKQERYHE